MAIEAYRRDEITCAKLLKLAGRVDVGSEEVEEILGWMGIEKESEDGIYYPEQDLAEPQGKPADRRT